MSYGVNYGIMGTQYLIWIAIKYCVPIIHPPITSPQQLPLRIFIALINHFEQLSCIGVLGYTL